MSSPNQYKFKSLFQILTVCLMGFGIFWLGVLYSLVGIQNYGNFWCLHLVSQRLESVHHY